MHFGEDFLHYIWKYRLFNQKNLHTINGQHVEILQTGIHNLNAGPDFENSRIRIEETVWAGNIEIHIRSSDWFKHNHQKDPAYNSVVLHVVYINDKEITRQNGTTVPQICISHLIPDNILNNYENLITGLNWIPCENQIQKVDDFIVKSWLSRILIERLEAKSLIFQELLLEFKGSWDDSFYVMLARNFGFKTNALPFELLARSLPQQILSKHKNNALQIEALIFGQAGFLEQRQTEDYPLLLKKEYQFLKAKYGLKPVEYYTWKYMRLRPANFPGIRLAQFAALILKSNHLFSKIIEVKNVNLIKNMFLSLSINVYWETHYRFNFKSEKSDKQIGDQSINNILINTVAVSLFAYGQQTGQQKYTDRAIELLENIPTENNKIVNKFIEIGLKPDKSNFSQGLLQLKNSYCDLKKCLFCGIGINLLKG
ncbi:MAG: DUF2851 family protein [Flavobacterium sp.]|nr:DUF2851 family protein [Pedobacter sp.]